MPRVAQSELFHPQLSHRYILISNNIKASAIYARGAEQPKVATNPISVDYGPTYINIMGRPKWAPITLTCYQFEGITAREVYSYFNKKHMVISSGEIKYADEYKEDINLLMMNAMTIVPIGRWKLIGAFISDLSGGSLDYGSDDIIELSLTLTYDYAEYFNV